MRHFKALITLSLLVSLSFPLVGCGGPKLKDEDLVGKWVAVKKTVPGGARDIGFVIEFFPDKTVSLPAGQGTWAVTNDGRVKIGLQKITMFGSIEKNLLTVTYPDQTGAIVFKKK